MTLSDPFPSAPSRPGKYVLYMGKRHDENADEVHIWCTVWAARKYLELVIDEDDFIMESKHSLRTESGIWIRCTELHEIINHEYTDEEANWDIPFPHTSYAANFRSGRALEIQAKMATEKRKPRQKSGKGKAREIRGRMSIGQLATELGMSPREARGILRKTKQQMPVDPVTKVNFGWSWATDEVDEIRKLLQANK